MEGTARIWFTSQQRAELWERWALRNARRSRGVLPPVGRCGGSHKAFDDRPRLSVGRLGAMAAAAPIARARPIGAPGSGRSRRATLRYDRVAHWRVTLMNKARLSSWFQIASSADL